MSHTDYSRGPSRHKGWGGSSSLIYTRPKAFMELETNRTAERMARWSPPPLSAYEEWLESRKSHGRNYVSASQYRRIAILVNQCGDTPGEAGRKIGVSNGKAVYDRLPMNLK